MLINNEYFLEPECLYFESMNDFSWSYFRLEVKTNKPFFGNSTYRNEEMIYIDSAINIYDKKVKNSKSVNFVLESSFLIVQKMANINSLSDNLDHYMGIHNKMTNDEYKILLQKVKNS